MADATEPKAPYDRRSEQILIGCLLRDPDLYDDVREVVGGDHLYFENHRHIFAAIEAARAAGAPGDPVAIHGRLKAAGRGVEKGEDYRYLVACRDGEFSTESAPGHARQVRSFAVYRRVMEAATEVMGMAAEQSHPAEEVAARAESLFAEVSELGAVGELVTDMDLIRRRLEIIAAGGEPEGLLTGLTDLDAVLCGMAPGELIVAGARPSKGKTALGLTFAANVARGGVPALMASLEMSGQSIADRRLTMMSGVPMQSFTGTRRVSSYDAEDLARAAVPVPGAAPLYIYDRPGPTPAELASVIRRAVRRKGVRFAVVDYIQLISPTNPRANRVEQIAEISRSLKATARAANIPILALAQLNRAAEEKPGQRPKMSNLREGGNLEQDADKVILIHHPEPDEPDLDDGAFTVIAPAPCVAVELLVDKNRNGPTGDVAVVYRKKAMRFENAVQPWKQ
ncbi:MAG TPA: DnaB-like helicase C-terminal domain-containing protein [Urbifossiella sp.]|nr:DnaB-like helicase C-terminal domain-containing protein [Urbifossiella sp.]